MAMARTLRLALLAALLLVPLAALGFVQPGFRPAAKKAPLTRRRFKVPTEPIPVVDTLEKKGNLTWSLPGA